MATFLVFSDSHGYKACLQTALAAVGPVDAVCHLGDGYFDCPAARYRVPGNCDPYTDAPHTVTIQTEAGLLLLTHGHLYNVKSTLAALGQAARQAGAVAALFGHTHNPCCQSAGGILYVNPGSVAFPKAARYPTYAVLAIGKAITVRHAQVTPGGCVPLQ